MATLARLTRFCYQYPGSTLPALAEIDLEIEPGLTRIEGHSGSGKSTLLRVLNGLVPQFYGGRVSGLAVVAGEDATRTPVRRLAAHTGFVFQDPESQLLQSRVENEVAFGPANLGLPGPEVRARARQSLERVGAAHLLERRVATLSGGERQRVAVAAALAMRPEILALDEPTSQLDPEGQAAVADLCADLARDGVGVVVADRRLCCLDKHGRRVGLEAGRVADGVGPKAPPGACPSPTPGELAWTLEGVAAGFGEIPVLQRVDLSGRRGEVVALTGPNGGGKTTLLRVIAGLLRPQAGRAWRAPGRTAYLPQNPTSLLHRPTLLAEIELTLRHSAPGEDPTAILKELGLEDLAHRYPRDLSGGERQRAALAAVLAGSPSVALLDEPTRGMDGHTRAALVSALCRLLRGGCALVLATHDAELLAELGARQVLVAGGRAA
jgi:energy-coupling factor transporter ATP-binding protein EcfA2